MGTDALFMDDNARLVRSYLESETFLQMAWPARSPDLNPIEYLWDMLGRRIAGRSVPPGTLHELQQAFTTGMGITATTNHQRHYCQHASPLSSMHFS
ncbi:hypothetical protein AVEN_181320-1 [Araneus ventricosus]|uniref:Tc1-like transposase DDE domain-containing protein n=1 Tax=Araneus ventricosus TaxID=182803 RepID=A0A4Y2EJ34_ARAVE|nr:hypothetical protein AVEN_181320-1 [Araneus ventricosus]